MRAKRYLAGALAGAATLTLAAGCAVQQIQALEPKIELREAARQLAAAQRAGFTLKITGSVDDLIAAVKPEQPSEEDLAIVRKLFHSSVTVAYDKAGEGTADDRSSLAATVDGVTGTEIRHVGGIVYAKAPVTELATTFGLRTADLVVPGLEPFVDGKWVSVDAKGATELAASGLLGLDAEQQNQEQALAELSTSAANLLDGADVVRDENDSRHLIVTSSTAKAHAEAHRFATAVEETLGDDLGEAPRDRPVVLDLWIDGGRLTAAEINLLQFVDGASGRVAARIEVTTGAPITAPDGATEIDPAGLFDGTLPSVGVGDPAGLLGPDDIGVAPR